MTDPNTEGAELAKLFIELEELRAEKKRLDTTYNEQIRDKERLIMEKAHHSQQIPLPFGADGA